MDVDANNHGKKGIAFFGVDAHIMKMVIIKHPVVYPFAGSTVLVDRLIFLCPSWNRSIEADIPGGLGIDAAAIGDGEHFSLQEQESVLPQASGHRHLRECFCLQYPQLTIRKPAIHKGVPSSSMERKPGIESGLPRFELRSIKGRSFHFWQSP